MNRSHRAGLVLALAVLVALPFGQAVSADQHTYVRHDERDWEDEGRMAFGIGFGLIALEEELFQDDVETYLNASLRIAVGESRRSGQGWRGYLEPELGYWESDGGPVPAVGTVRNGTGIQRGSTSDLLLGINIVGVQPVRAVDFFIGAGIGIHFLDTDVNTFTRAGGVTTRSTTSVSDEALGLNAHFGVDVNLSPRASLFGVGRFDIVDDEGNDLDVKAYLGVRFGFGGHRGKHWSPDEEE